MAGAGVGGARKAIGQEAYRPGIRFMIRSPSVIACAKVLRLTPGGGAMPITRCTATVCDSVYFRMPFSPCRRPTPESFMPPIGASCEAQAAEYPSLMLTVPALIRVAISRPRCTFEVQMLAFNP